MATQVVIQLGVEVAFLGDFRPEGLVLMWRPADDTDSAWKEILIPFSEIPDLPEGAVVTTIGLYREAEVLPPPAT